MNRRTSSAIMKIGDRLGELVDLERENGNKARAARALGIHRRKLYRMLERWSEHPTVESQE